MSIVYNNLYEDNGKWCVQYTDTATNQTTIKCFDTNEEAVAFYMS